MPKDKAEDKLGEGASRLGDRFAGTISEERREVDESEAEDEADSQGVEWVPTTVYLPENERREFRRFLKQVTLDYPEIEAAQKRELHTAVLRTGMGHPEEVAETTEEFI